MKKNMRITPIGIIIILCIAFFSYYLIQNAISDNDDSTNYKNTSDPVAAEKEIEYKSLTAKEAFDRMQQEKDAIILDVRTQEEYETGYIKGATLIPDDELEQKAKSILLDKNQTIFVYCRSGRRSKLAANILNELGYTNVYDFGGIIDWPYEIVK